MTFQRMRFTVPIQSPELRWALTPPFHPYPKAVYSLLHLLSTQSMAFLLGSILPYTVRTFLFLRSDKARLMFKLKM